jgi:hypothetical protein
MGILRRGGLAVWAALAACLSQTAATALDDYVNNPGPSGHIHHAMPLFVGGWMSTIRRVGRCP